MELMEETATELRVLALLGPNDKLCIRNGNLSVDHRPWLKSTNRIVRFGSHALDSATRWLYQDSRFMTLLKIKELVRKTHSLTPLLQTPEAQEAFDHLLNEAVSGLHRLQETYRHDAAVSARLGVYIQSLTPGQACAD